MPHEKLQKELSKYDVGLAIEDVSADLNRNICLTNKIWSYFQAGLFIMAADTAAQKLFIEEHPLHGICTPLAKESLYVLFEKLVNAKESIRSLKKERFGNASLVNWENESRVLIKEWDTIIWS